MAKITIVKKGAYTTVQDLGRTGHQADGVRVSGACDLFSMRLADRLCGNEDGAAVLECTLYGGRMRFSDACTAAFTGAEMPLLLNGSAVPRNAAFQIPAGGELEIGAASRGIRGYLAVSGGIDMPCPMGSRSSEKALAEGAELPYFPKECAPCSIDADGLRKVASRVRLTDGGPVRVLRFVPGPQEERFDISDFERNLYTVKPDSDRMGARLDGAPLASACGYDILSDGIAPGAIQIAGNGLPVVMLAAHQTTGGYAKIGTVIRADLKHIAQLRPGETVCFSRVTPGEARAYLLAEEKILTNGGM